MVSSTLNGENAPAPVCPTTIVVGTLLKDYGRECEFHSGCGFFLKIGTVVQFVRELYDGTDAVAVYARFVSSKRTPCRVGWIAKELVNTENWDVLEGIVRSFLVESKESEVRRQNNAKHGAVEVALRAKSIE